MIAGIGIDLVSVGRMKKIIDRWDSHFTRRIFTSGEIDYCAKKAFPAIHFAARFPRSPLTQAPYHPARTLSRYHRPWP